MNDYFALEIILWYKNLWKLKDEKFLYLEKKEVLFPLFLFNN